MSQLILTDSIFLIQFHFPTEGSVQSQTNIWFQTISSFHWSKYREVPKSTPLIQRRSFTYLAGLLFQKSSISLFQQSIQKISLSTGLSLSGWVPFLALSSSLSIHSCFLAFTQITQDLTSCSSYTFSLSLPYAHQSCLCQVIKIPLQSSEKFLSHWCSSTVRSDTSRNSIFVSISLYKNISWHMKLMKVHCSQVVLMN